MGWQIWVVSAFVAYSDTPASGSKSAPCSESCLGCKKQQNAGHHEMTSLRVCKSWIPFHLTRKWYLHLFGGSSAIILRHTQMWVVKGLSLSILGVFPSSFLMSNNFKEKSPLQTYQTEMSSFILQWILIKLKLRGSQDSTKKTLS